MLIAPILLGLAVAAPIEDIPKRADVVIMTTTQEMGWGQLFGFGGTTQQPAIATPVVATTAAAIIPTTTPKAFAAASNIATAANTPAANTPAAAAAAPAVAPSTPSTAQAAPASSANNSNGGFFSSLLNMFGGSLSSPAPAAGSVAQAAPAASPTQAPVQAQAPALAPAASSSSSGGSGWFSNLVSSIFGGGGGSTPQPSVPSTAPAGSVKPSSSQSQFGLANPSTIQLKPSSSAVGFSSLQVSSSTSASSGGAQPAFTGLVTVEGAGGDTGSSPSGSKPSPGSNGQVSQIVSYAEGGAGITYSPYTKSGQCKSANEVASDIQKLLAFGIIRLYSVDCSGIQNVISAMSSGQKLFLGVWDINNINSDLPSMAQQVLSGKRGWSAVHTVAIGNEVVNSGRGSASQVANAVNAAKSWFQANAPQYSGPIVCVDTLAAVMANPQQMCGIGDYLAVNCHPYFSGVEASTSGTWLKQQVSQLQQTCGGGKSILVTESGWPSYGNTVGQAVPSLQNQLLSIKSLSQVIGDQVIMFTMYNDYWKAPGDWNVEQHWGIYGDPSS
ncbi:hypothetical protein PUMCH_000994 [Australozyma saopauloensis]|uniref:Uncharacterized protein n=1 Tax=Australozyma saopauloensis TaxID=291208 RepID=A0AAX4H5N1_9ASCO|nr:hypothetical protein PUMCH_000994 [[Candida] saopauloensis]